MHKAVWVLWLTNQPGADSTLVPSTDVTDAVTYSVSIPDEVQRESSVPASQQVSVEQGTKSQSFEVSTESVTSRYSSEHITDTGPVETPVLLPVSITLDQTRSESMAVTKSVYTPAPDSASDSYITPSTASESEYVYHPAFVPASAPATIPAAASTVSANVVLPDSLESITQYHTVSHYAPGPYPAVAPGSAPAIGPESQTAVVVEDGGISVTRHGLAADLFGDAFDTLTQPWDEALFGSLESAVWSPHGQYLLFSDSEHAVLPDSWDEDDHPDATKLGRIYKWDAATNVVSVFLESAGTLGPDDESLPEVPALADKMTAGAVGLAWGWEAGELLVTQYAKRRVVKLNVQDVANGEVPIEKVVPWSGSVSPNGDGSFNGPHSIFVADDVALFTDPPTGLELQAWDENGKRIKFSSQTTEQLKATAGATATNGVYAVDKHRSTQLIIDDIQMPHGVSWSHDRIFVSGSQAEQSGIFVYETRRGDPTLPWQSKMIDGSVYMTEGEGHFGSMALAGDLLLVAGPSGIYVVDSAKVELVGFVEFSKCFPVGIAAGNVASDGKNYAFVLTQCMDEEHSMDSGRPSLKRLELKAPLEAPEPVDMCTTGTAQSPVDLAACVSVPQPVLSTDWGVVQMSRVSDDDAQMKLVLDDLHWPPPSFSTSGTGYHLRECHFHWRQGHTISSEQQELELQCVHSKDFSDRLGVLSVFFIDSNQESAFLSQIQGMGATAGIDFDELFTHISDKSRYWSYKGSQISGLCTENVDYYIIMEKVPMSMAQSMYFKDVAFSAPEAQPLNGRDVTGCFREFDWLPYVSGHEWAYSVDKNHVVCDQGTKQSPINLEYCPDADMLNRAPLEADWGIQNLNVAKTEYRVEMTLQTPSQTNIEGTGYTLTKCSLLWGSEHFVDSHHQAAELQCLHTKDSVPGRYGLITLFLEGGGSDNAFLSSLGLPISAPVEATANFNTLLINDAVNYYSYEGSFTLPPCTEAVDWFILMSPQVVSDSQLTNIEDTIGWNKEGGIFRPPQPLHGRTVHGCNMHDRYAYDESKWGGVCATGTEQSPVDLRSCDAGLNRPDRLNFDAWRRAPIKVHLSNANGVTLTPFKDDYNPIQDVHHQPQEDNLYSVMFGTDMTDESIHMYKLEQCNIHLGSEHTVDGNQFRAEMHCVQRRSDDTNRYGILGILWDVGSDPHAFWEPIEDHFPTQAEKQLRHVPGPEASVESFSESGAESVWAHPDSTRRLQSSESVEVPASVYGGIAVDVDGAPAYLSAPHTVSESFSVPFEGKIPGYIPAVREIPSPDYTKPTLQWPSNYYPALAKAEVPALPATLFGSDVQHSESASAAFPATQAVMWGFPLEPSHGIARPYWRAGCHTLGKDECCSYLDGRHDQFYGEVCVAAIDATFSTGNVCEPQCVVTGDCPWGAGSDEVVNVAMCADQAEHWVNFELLFDTLDLNNFWNYHGSWTTPPCSEVVDWFVLMNPALMSESQFVKLQMATGEVATGGNFRPPQSLGGRVPEGCTTYSSPWIGKTDAPQPTYPYNRDNWGNSVMNAHAACAAGTQQSPINLDACVAKNQPEMELEWGSQEVSLVLDHGLKITPSNQAISSTIQGTMYTLQHCNWHFGSEHTVDDHQHVMESQCIHTRGTTERYGVVGIFWEVGRESAFLKQIEDSLPEVETPAPAPIHGYVSCGAGVEAESCAVCGQTDQCGSPDGDCEPDPLEPDACVLRTRDCGKGIHVQGFCADCPADQCESQCEPSDDDQTCQEKPPDRRLTEAAPQAVGIAAGGIGVPTAVTIPAARMIPASDSVSESFSHYTQEPGGSEPGFIPTGAQGAPASLTPGYVPYFLSASDSSTVSESVSVSEAMTWGFPVLPDHGLLGRHYASDGCMALDREHCCFYMDGLRQVAAEGPQRDDLHALEGNAYGEPCRPVSKNAQGAGWSCAPECWVTGDCEWYIAGEASRAEEAGVCWDRFADHGQPIDLNLLFHGMDLTRYWSYEGSFTTPPCSEVVDWFVMMDLAELSQAQLGMLEVAMGPVASAGTFRPPQALNGRVVDGCVYHPDWYKGEYVDEEWGYYVQGAHSVCEVGQQQSPIDLTSCVEATERARVDTTWGVLDFSMTNTGHAVKLSVTSTGAATDIGGVHYTLQQCNFHWGSEHTIDNLQHRMETHCVHTKDHNAGMYGIVGLFYQVGDFSNAFMAVIEDNLPADPSDEFLGSADFDALTDGINMRHYWSYDGSFTAPPCTEAVDWYLLMDHAYLSEEQFGKFQMATGHAGGLASANGNFRPPQPLNERQVLGCGRMPDMEGWLGYSADLYPYSADAWASDVENAHEHCAMGSRQSPIDLNSCLSDPQPQLMLPWDMQNVVLRGTGQVRVTLNDNNVHSGIKGADYKLEECHFRSGSEHRVDGGQFHLEMQCVHRQETLERYGVIAVLFHLGEWESEGNAFLGQVAEHLPLEVSDSGENLPAPLALDFSSLWNMLDKTRYWSYEGSMTTPPCTEIVDWFVMMDSVEMSVSQLDVFKATIGVPGGNFRPPQPLHDRPVTGCARHADWYSADNMNWAYDVADHHAICDSGVQQSPIDLSVCAHVMDRPAMRLTWGTPSGTLRNTGNSVVFDLEQPSQALSVIVNKHYTVHQCSYHWGSQHFVEGMQQRMEVQCVHTKNGHAGHFGILGMFYDVESTSDTNSFVVFLADKLPSKGDTVELQNVELESLVEGADFEHFWSYDGSLTTPPCTEVVDWYVLMDHAVMSSEQYDEFQNAIGQADPAGGNFRPPQPLNGRYIDGCRMPDNDLGDVCDSGTQQSPINLHQCTGREVAQLPLSVEWGQQTVYISSSGDLRLELVNAQPTSILKGTEYKLLECSLHFASEHTVNTNSYDLEFQCHHQGYADTRGVVTIFFEVGDESDENLFLSDFVSDLDELPDNEGVDFDHLWSGIDRTKYWDYKGSLTTPPCTESVDWYVVMQVAKLSPTQYSAITSTIGGAGNFRAPQELHGRSVGGCVPMAMQYPYDAEHWGDLDEACSTGTMQSPIQLTECAARVARPAINMDLITQQVEVMNNALTVKLSVENPVPATMVGDVAYTLQHCEFHWGSEHFVEHMQRRFEVQCVHTKVLDSSRYGVVAVFFELASSHNAFFAPFEDSLVSSDGVQRQVNFGLLMAELDAHHYWSYEGSFTSPPCTEAVDWYVMMDSSSLSSQQFDKFQNAIGFIEENGNFRPPQPLNGRGVVGCQDADFMPEPTTTTTTPLPPYEEVHAGACMGGWLGTNLKTATVWGCHLACLDMPACGYFSYNDIDNTCARYSPFQRCPEDTGNRYPTYRSFRENRNIFEDSREVSSYDTKHAGPCASGWLSSQNARMDTTDDCAQWCAGHLICRYFAFSSSSQMCSLYSAYSMCPARTDNRYAGTDWMSYILYTVGEEVPPAAPTPEENLNFFFVHQGHCAAGWMSGHNTHVASLEECITKCFMTPTCGYISYSERATTCSLYRGNARCPADNNYPDFASYRIAMV